MKIIFKLLQIIILKIERYFEGDLYLFLVSINKTGKDRRGRAHIIGRIKGPEIFSL